MPTSITNQSETIIELPDSLDLKHALGIEA
jgi:hypothetical protein